MPSAKDLIQDSQKIEGVRGGVLVSKEDGTLLFKGEGVLPDTPEMVAFVGGAAEVMASLLDLGTLTSAVVSGGDNKLLIVPHEDSFLGLEVGALGPWWIEAPEVGDILLGGKVGELEDVEKVFREKLKLLNLLVEEFSKGGDPGEWLKAIMGEIATIDPGGKLSRYLQVAEGQIKSGYGAKAGLTKKEISEVFEKLVNSVCKRAIGVFGFVEVKQRFKGVIEKLAAGGKA
jgi:predicted regulator of Ras-like GTPase activity (Roadblock/LC7/MglB family)